MTKRKLEVVIAGDADGLAKAFDRAAEMGQGFGGKMSSAMKAGGALLVTAGAAMGALAVKGFVDGVGIQADQSKFAAQMGLDPEEAARLGGIAGDLYANAYGQSLGEVQEIVRGVVTGVNEELSDVELSNLSAQVADVGTAFDQDFNAVIQTAQNLVNNGLVPDFESALDVITKGFQTVGPQGADEFLDTLNEYSDAFEQLGIDGPTAIGLIEKGLENGAFSVDKIGDAFKEFSLRAIEDSDNVSQAYTDLGLDADEFRTKLAEGGPAAKDAMSQVIQALASVEDPIERNRLGIEFFGTQWEDLGESVVLGLDPAKVAVEDLSQVTENMGDTLNDNLMVKWETFKRQALMGTAEVMVNNVIPAVERGVEWITNLADVFRNEGFEAGVKKLADEAGKLATVLRDKLAEAIPVVVDKLKELGGKFSDWIVEATPPMLAKLGELLTDLGAWIVNTGLPTLANKLAEWATAFTGWLADVVPPLLSQLDDLLASISSWVREKGVPALAEKVKEWVPAFVGWVVDVAPDLIKNLGELILQIQKWVVTEAAPALARELASWALAFVEWIGEAHKAIVAELPGVAQAIYDWAKEIPGKVLDALGDLGSYLVDKGGDLISGLASGAETAAVAVFDWFGKLPGEVVDKVGDVASTLLTKGSDLIRGLWDGITGLFGSGGSGGGGGSSTVLGFIAGIPAAVVTAIGDVAGTLAQKGADLIGGLLAGAGLKALELASWVAGLPAQIFAWLGTVTSTLASKGVELIGGLISGAGLKAIELAAWFVGLPAKIVGWLGNVGSALFNAGADLIGGLISGITSKIPGLSTAISSVNSAISGITGAPSVGGGIAEVVKPAIKTGTSSPFGKTARAAGGVVPGRIGELVPILAHGGEEIRPLGSTRQRSGGGQGNVFAPTVNLHGPATLADANRVIEALNDWADVHGPIPIAIRGN